MIPLSLKSLKALKTVSRDTPYRRLSSLMDGKESPSRNSRMEIAWLIRSANWVTLLDCCPNNLASIAPVYLNPFLY